MNLRSSVVTSVFGTSKGLKKICRCMYVYLSMYVCMAYVGVGKTLLISPAALTRKTTGEISNLMAVDSTRLQVNTVCVCMYVYVLCMYVLYYICMYACNMFNDRQ